MVEQKVVKPKTQRSKRVLAKKEPKLVENTKTCMIIKGGNTSECISSVLRDIQCLKKPHSLMYKRKNVLRPFEDESSLEFFSQRSDAALFIFGCHSKKRPHNIIFGRLFDGHILDMMEFGIEKYIGLNDFPTSKIGVGIKPCMVFVGELFDNDSTWQRIKCLMLDMFHGEEVDQIRLNGLEHVWMFTADNEHLYIRSYRILLKKSGSRLPRIELEEIGPSLDLTLRRTKLASEDLYKKSRKQPKELKPKKQKNISHDVFGTKFGRVHLERQDLSKLQTRKMKGLKRLSGKDKAVKRRKVKQQ